MASYKSAIRPGELDIEDHAEDGRHTLALAGELDIATAPALEARIAALCREGASQVTLDLSELDFLDSTGFRAILIGKEHCEEHHCEFFMSRGKDSIQRLFDVGGVLEKLPFRDVAKRSHDARQDDPDD